MISKIDIGKIFKLKDASTESFPRFKNKSFLLIDVEPMSLGSNNLIGILLCGNERINIHHFDFRFFEEIKTVNDW